MFYVHFQTFFSQNGERNTTLHLFTFLEVKKKCYLGIFLWVSLEVQDVSSSNVLHETIGGELPQLVGLFGFCCGFLFNHHNVCSLLLLGFAGAQHVSVQARYNVESSLNIFLE